MPSLSLKKRVKTQVEKKKEILTQPLVTTKIDIGSSGSSSNSSSSCDNDDTNETGMGTSARKRSRMKDTDNVTSMLTSIFTNDGAVAVSKDATI